MRISRSLASVSAGTTLINTGDDSTDEGTTVNPVARMATSVTGAPDPAAAGTALTYAVSLSNTGPGDAADATLYQVVYDSMLFVQRRHFHRQVADALERLYPDRRHEQAGLLAHHWERAGESVAEIEPGEPPWRAARAIRRGDRR